MRLKNARFFPVLLAVLAVLSGLASVQAQVVLRLGHGLAQDHAVNQGAEYFAQLVDEWTNGEVAIDIYPAGQLGGNQDQFEALMLGDLDIQITNTNIPDAFGQPLWKVLEAGYTFRDYQHAARFFQGPFLTPIIEKLEDDLRVTVLTPYWYYGVRHLTADRPVNNPSELSGVKIRVPEVPGFVETLQGMGASPTPVAFAELYLAMQTGVVDGQENPFATIYQYNLYEVQDYLMLTSHIVSKNTVFMNLDSYERLSPEHQEALREAAYLAGLYQDELVLGSEQSFLDLLRESGMTIVEPDVDAFAEGAKSFLFDHFFSADERLFYDEIQRIVELNP